jgi:hypothetical protein
VIGPGLGEFPRTSFRGSPVSEKNSSRKLADQARLPTPRYLIGMRVYECRFPRMSLLGFSVNRDNAVPRIRAAYAPHHGGQEIAQLASLLVQGIRYGVMVPG